MKRRPTSGRSLHQLDLGTPRTAVPGYVRALAAARLLEREESWAGRALARASGAWWTASLSGRSRDYQRMEAADRAVNRHYSRPPVHQRLRRLLQAKELEALTRRRLQRLELAYRSKQAPVAILDRITSAEAAVQETYSTFRADF